MRRSPRYLSGPSPWALGLALAIDLAQAAEPPGWDQVLIDQDLIEEARAYWRERTGAEPDAAQLVRWLSARARRIHRRGVPAEALEIVETALRYADETLGADHEETLETLAGVALLQRVLAPFDEAEASYQRLMAGRKRTLRPEHPETLANMESLAALYRSRRRYAEAEALLKRTIEGWKGTKGSDHPGTLNSLTSLSHLYKSEERWDLAAPLYQHLLEVTERKLGRHHPTWPRRRPTMRRARPSPSMVA